MARNGSLCSHYMPFSDSFGHQKIKSHPRYTVCNGRESSECDYTSSCQLSGHFRIHEPCQKYSSNISCANDNAADLRCHFYKGHDE
ncbi:hypothetical protein J6590_015896 [Homalodisca vitripennis]|nr:hypothetical protein J6590_015896 [Homalodisca vitripennis]